MKCLIIAAGMGTRLRGIAPSKPLARLNGTPLIEQVIVTAAEAGVTEFVVVTGYGSEGVEAWLADLAPRIGRSISTIRNTEWERPNGLSVLAARETIHGPFVLLMSDHLFEAETLADLLAHGVSDGEVVLAVDRRLDNPLVDPEDVTFVKSAPDGRIVRIGKGLPAWDAFDTGMFLATPALFDAIADDVASNGTGSLSAGMQRLADQGRARTFDIGDRWWIDVDDATAFAQAERGRAAVP